MLLTHTDNLAEVICKSDLVTTPELDKYRLRFNLVWKLFICGLCEEGIPFRSLNTHLSASELSRWTVPEDGTQGRQAHVATGHLPCTKIDPRTVRGKQFFERIGKTLVKAGFISSTEEIADGHNNDWHSNFPTFPTYPVEGIRVTRGFTCATCGHSVRSPESRSKHHLETSCRNTQFEECFVQTFAEQPIKFFPVAVTSLATNIVSDAPTKPDAPQLLQRAKARLLAGVPIVAKVSAQTLLPIYINSGIERWIQRFDRSALPGLLPKVPQASGRAPRRFAHLWRAVLDLFITDMKKLEGDELHHTICHLLTNATP